MPGKLSIFTVTFAARNLTSAIDHGFFDRITFDELNREIENGNLITFLEEKLNGGDWSLVGPVFDQGPLFVEAMKQRAVRFKNYEHEIGIHNSGTCLLLAFCIEEIQLLTPIEGNIRSIKS